MHILKIIARNSLRHKLRTALTVLGTAVAILAFGLLRTVIDAWYSGVDASSASRLVTRNSVSLVFPLPLSYREKIRQVDGVRIISYGNWFGGVYVDEKNFFPNFAVDPATYLDLYPEYVLPAAQRESFVRDRRSFVAGRKLVEKYRWKIGDTVTLKGTIFPGNWEFVLRGIYQGRDKNTDETQFFFHWDHLNENLKKTAAARADQVGFYMIGVTSPRVAADVTAAVDKIFKNSLAETLTETEKAFQLGFVAMSEAILVAIELVSIVVIVIILAVVANTMAMTARERFAEYAVFKALGFRWWHIGGMILGESLFITMTGCAVGVALTFPAAGAFVRAVGTFIPVFNVDAGTIALDILVSAVVGCTASVIPLHRAAAIRIADGLRRIG